MFKLIATSRYLPFEQKAKIDLVIQRNCYFAHPENLLLAMLTNNEPHIRKLVAPCILKARSNQETGLRPVHLPTLNFEALYYVDLIN